MKKQVINLDWVNLVSSSLLGGDAMKVHSVRITFLELEGSRPLCSYGLLHILDIFKLTREMVTLSDNMFIGVGERISTVKSLDVVK